MVPGYRSAIECFSGRLWDFGLWRRPAAGVRNVEKELLHVPSAGRTALRAQAAVEADIFVFRHHALGL
jgi:hypothetical protein